MKKSKKNLLLVLTGALTGAVNGFFGGGGGMIVVPLLALVLGQKPKVAHATAIAIILPVCIASGIMYMMFGNFEAKAGISVTVGFVAGGVLGALLLKKLNAKWVVKIFAVVMLVAGVKLLFF